jgi:hypothetical protein
MSTEDKTRTSDPAYDLVSVVYHALQGAETSERYVEDAAERGDKELADFFRDAQRHDADIAERGKALLRTRLDR